MRRLRGSRLGRRRGGFVRGRWELLGRPLLGMVMCSFEEWWTICGWVMVAVAEFVSRFGGYAVILRRG